MWTLQSLESPAAKVGPARVRGAVVLAALVAIAAMIAITIGLTRRHTTGATRSAVTTHTSYVPLIQYRGTGAPPVAPVTHVTTGAGSTTGLLRAEHSYGAVP
jgi:hypothetical protein